MTVLPRHTADTEEANVREGNLLLLQPAMAQPLFEDPVERPVSRGVQKVPQRLLRNLDRQSLNLNKVPDWVAP